MTPYQDLVHRLIEAGVWIQGASGLTISQQLLKDAAWSYHGPVTIVINRLAAERAHGSSLQHCCLMRFESIDWVGRYPMDLVRHPAEVRFLYYGESYHSGGDEYGVIFPTPRNYRGSWRATAIARLIREADQTWVRLIRFATEDPSPRPFEMKPRPADIPINHPDVGRIWLP